MVVINPTPRLDSPTVAQNKAIIQLLKGINSELKIKIKRIKFIILLLEDKTTLQKGMDLLIKEINSELLLEHDIR